MDDAPGEQGQAFCPESMPLTSLYFNHRGRITMLAKIIMITLLDRGVFITSGLAHKKVVSPARTSRSDFEITFKGLKKYLLRVPAKKMMATTSPNTTVMISRLSRRLILKVFPP